MQDAFGGIMNLILITIFLVIVSGVLGFSVNYTKAFKMKNIVISAIEEYEDSGCFKEGTECWKKIDREAKNIGYSPSNLNCSGDGEYSDFTSYGGLFCATRVETNSSEKDTVAYRIITQVDIDIPIIRDIMGFSIFQVKGDTRVIQKSIEN